MAAVKIPYRDIPASRDGNGYITINGTTYPAFKIAKLSPRAEMKTDSKQFLGERVEQSATRGVRHTFDLDYYMMSSVMVQAVKDYEDGGEYPDISIQYYAEKTKRGRQEVLLTGVILENVGFGALDDSSDNSQVHSTTGTFDDFQIVSKYKD